jgi:hypothetical protein
MFKITKTILIFVLLFSLITTASAATYTKTANINTQSGGTVSLGHYYDPTNISDLSIAVTQNYPETSPYDIPSDGLYAYWKFDEGAGTTIADTTGNHNNLTSSRLEWNESGKYNNAAQFNGVNATVSYNNVNFTNNLTIITWVYQTQAARDIMGKWSGGATNKSFILYTSNTTLNKLVFAISGDGSNASSYSNSTVGVPLNQWTMIAVTYNGSYIKEYLNMRQVYGGATTISSLYQAPQNMYMGSSYIAGYYKGNLDNTIMYDRALNETELNQIYYDGLIDVTFNTNSNTTQSNSITGSGSTDIPYSSSDYYITNINALASTSDKTISGVVVRDYANTSSPFDAIVTIQSDDVFDYGVTGNGKVAILTDSVYSAEPAFYNQITQERNMKGFTAFYGYKYDVIDYSVATDRNLEAYSTVVAISPDTQSRGLLVSNFTENTGRYAMTTGNISSQLASRYGLTYTGFNNTSAGMGTFVGALTTKLVNWGSNSRYVYSLSGNAISNMKTTQGESGVVTSTKDSGRIVFQFDANYNTKTGQSRLMKNYYSSLAMPTETIVQGYTPYAEDMAIMLRYDDYAANHTEQVWYKDSYVNFTNLAHDCTVAAPVSVLNAGGYHLLADKGVDVIPHSYEHINLGTLSYADQYAQLLNIKTNYPTIAGKQPFGIIPPGNGANDSTLRALNELGNDVDTFRFVTGIDTSPCSYYYGNNDSTNDVWWLGHRNTIEGSTDYSVSGYNTLMTGGLYAYDVAVGHPNQASVDYGGITYATVIQHTTTIINSSNSIDGLYMSTMTDFIQHLDDSKYVTVYEDTMYVTRNVGSGLTLTNASGVTENIIIDDSIVTIINRNNKVMLPALAMGTHTIEYSNEYPHIETHGGGGIIRVGYYDIPTGIMYFSIHDDDELSNESTMTLSGFDSDKSYTVTRVGATDVGVITTGSITLTGLLEGDYIVKETVDTAQLTVIAADKISGVDQLLTSSEIADNIYLSTTMDYSDGLGLLYHEVTESVSNGFSVFSIVILLLGAVGVMRYFGFM